MKFEFDFNKSKSNKKKHGIDFVAAQTLWDDPDMVEIPTRFSDEQRFLVVGRISGKRWSGIMAYCGENIKIISVRRSRKEEVDVYES